MMIAVEVKTTTGEYTTHSTHDTWSDAVDQCDMVHGRIIVDSPETELVFLEWSNGEENPSYSCWDYFRDGVYQGADEYGIEPLFEAAE